MMVPRISVISVWAEDVASCIHFYRDLLGFELLEDHGSQPHFNLDGAFLTIVKGTPHPATNADPEDFPLFAVRVDDLDAMIERLRKASWNLPWEVVQAHAARWIKFHDPAGNLIELVEFKHP